jgi:glycosyltransferase involved in cell wall biosynthesis
LKRLIYLSPVPWSSFAQRPHKFVTWFHASTGGEVLWFDPYPTRLPRLSDFRRIRADKANENDTHPFWLEVEKPVALPIEPFEWSGVVNTIFWRSSLRRMKVFSHLGDCVLVIGKPSVFAISVLTQLKYCASVYDAMDDFSEFYLGFSRNAMRAREEQIVRCVGKVITSSSALETRWTKLRADIHLVRNGFDFDKLPAHAIVHPPKAKKILGYVGTIASWFDWDWLIDLAEKRSGDTIRLIGPILTPAPQNLPGNIEILPPCSHLLAMLAIQDFDIGLIPFKKNLLTASVDPIKYYEYRAIGLPVISTNFGEMAYRASDEGVFLSFGLQDIGQAVEAALKYEPTNSSIENFRSNNTWSSRFDSVNLFGKY